MHPSTSWLSDLLSTASKILYNFDNFLIEKIVGYLICFEQMMAEVWVIIHIFFIFMMCCLLYSFKHHQGNSGALDNKNSDEIVVSCNKKIDFFEI